MRQLLVALAIAGLAAPAFAAEPDMTRAQIKAKRAAEAQARCQRYQAQPAAQPPGANGLMKPTESPPARIERAVNRRIDGCVVPVIIRQDAETRDR